MKNNTPKEAWQVETNAINQSVLVLGLLILSFCLLLFVFPETWWPLPTLPIGLLPALIALVLASIYERTEIDPKAETITIHTKTFKAFHHIEVIPFSSIIAVTDRRFRTNNNYSTGVMLYLSNWREVIIFRGTFSLENRDENRCRLISNLKDAGVSLPSNDMLGDGF